MPCSRSQLCAVVAAFFCLSLHKKMNGVASNRLAMIREMMDEVLAELNTMFLFILVQSYARRRRLRNPSIGRRAWAWPRPQQWFDILISTPGLDPVWKPNFRMERATFDERVWRLATGNSFRTCGLQFGIGTSTAKQVCHEFDRALCRRINLFIKFPNTPAEIKAVMDEFEEQFHFPQIVGAIDGSHIEIKSPIENHEDYFDRKHYYSVNLQAIVDSELLFRHVAVGFPGSIHDSRVLQLSGLLDMANNRQILTAPTRNINGVDVRPMLVGDSAYPLSN